MPTNWFMFTWGGIVLLTLWVFYKLIKSRRTTRITYQRQNFLLSQEEKQLYAALYQAVGEDYVIFAKIRVDDLVSPRSSPKGDQAWEELEALEETHFNFVLSSKTDLSIACAIQLIQHKTHDQKTNPTGGALLKVICQSAGLPLVRLEAGPFYDTVDIREAIAEAVKKEPLFIMEPDGRREPRITDLDRMKS